MSQTVFEVYFELAGENDVARLELAKRKEVYKKAEAFCNDLEEKANKDLDPHEWPGNFPEFPEDREKYENFVQHDLVRVAFKSIIPSVQGEFENLHKEIDFTKKFLPDDNSKLVQLMRGESGKKFFLKSMGNDHCVPNEPPPGSHICETCVFFSPEAEPELAQKQKWFISHEGQTYGYTINCIIYLKLEEKKKRNITGSSWGTERNVAVENHRKCIENAHKLHDTYASGSEGFPVFWRLIDERKDFLADIYVFFCETLEIQRKRSSDELTDVLWKSLSRRWTKAGPPNLSDEIKGNITQISNELVQAFSKLVDNDLVGPAFFLFASGSLTSKRYQFMTSGKDAKLLTVQMEEAEQPQPDSGGYFFWVEFALLAMKNGDDFKFWARVLPELLKSERIFALCYGGRLSDGTIPENRKFVDYKDPRLDLFQRIHVSKTWSIGGLTMPTTDIEILEKEATDCARFAFPKNFQEQDE